MHFISFLKNYTNLGMLFRQLHIVKNPKKNLKQILPPMRLEGCTMGFNDVEEYCQGARPDVQLTPTNHAG